MNAPFVFKDITVVTPDEQGQVHVTAHAWVCIDGQRITAIDTEQSYLQKPPVPGTVFYDGRNRIMLPVLVNAHNHMAMTLLRNAADDVALQPWLFDHIFPREAKLTAQIVAAGSRLALVEMIRNGIGATADMYYYHEETAKAALEAGFRLNTAVDVKKQDAAGSTLIDAEWLNEQIQRFQNDASGLLRISMLVHSVYLYEASMYQPLARLAEATACPVHLHLSETRKEVMDCQKRYGMKPAARLEAFGFFRTRTLAAHCVYLDDSERSILSEHGVYAVHCPASNLKLGSGVADITAMCRSQIPVVLGTDGAASNNNLDLYRDLRMAAFLAKGSREDASVMSAHEILPMATSAGMQALGFEQSGRIEPGAFADLQIVRTDVPGMTPLGDPVSALVYSANSSDVESVMVAGRWLMEKRELKTLDEEKIMFEAQAAAARLDLDEPSC
ncbi:MAG: amidohydrolase [Clostridiaceae bacterium]|nr:amidohydrolase [Clostridiaceae bacterium]